MKLILQILLLASVAFMAQGCDDSKSSYETTHSQSNFVKITSITPSLGEPLVVGSHLNFKVTAQYSLKEESGTITLVIQRSESNFRPLANEFEVVPSGQGEVTLEATIDVPDTKAIQVFLPLNAQGAQETTTVDSRAFKVISN